MDEKETRPWEPYIPTYVDMYYVDYRDDLSDNTKLLQDCIDKNSLYPISEYLDDWWEYPEAQQTELGLEDWLNDVLDNDGWCNILNHYDGKYEEYTVGKDIICVSRT